MDVDPQLIAREIRRRLGARIKHPAEAMAEIERVVAERPTMTDKVRIAIERELLGVTLAFAHEAARLRVNRVVAARLRA